MTDLTLIASRLNMRAVDLDGKTPGELLEVLINVIRKLDNQFDAANLSRGEVISRVVHFLQTHKCDLLPSASSKDEWGDWIVSLESGEKWQDHFSTRQRSSSMGKRTRNAREIDRSAVISLLHWALSNCQELKKRCYLAPFLMPVEVPEILSASLGTVELSRANDDTLYDLLESYRELQHDFVKTHKAFESLKESKALPISELSAEIDSVDREKKQLLDILQRDKRMTDISPKFQQLLVETSQMTQSEEHALRLEQQKIEHMEHTEVAKKRLQEVRRLRDAMNSNATSIDHCIAELEKESKKAVLHLETQLIPQRLRLEAMVAKAEKDASNKFNQGGDEEYLLKLEEKNAYITENQRLRDALEEMIETSGINMSQHHFQELQFSLQEKLKRYQSEREEISAIQKQLLELEGKKEELTESLQVVEGSLQQQEEKGEITGFREVHKQLSHTFQETCVLNEIKSDTLDEMSAIVNNIAVTLDGKRETLEPKVSMHV
jgi:hypothetical protein